MAAQHFFAYFVAQAALCFWGWQPRSSGYCCCGSALFTFEKHAAALDNTQLNAAYHAGVPVRSC
jgi:hypothetical protein